MKLKSWFIGIGLIIFLFIGILLTYRFQKTSGDETIKIGYFGPLSGPLGVSTGESIVEAFKLAHEQNPLIQNYRIEVIYEDDKCESIAGVSAVQKLLNKDKVDFLVSGLCSRSTLAVAPLAEERRKILISAGAAAPSITDAGDYVFRLSASSVLSGKKAASILHEKGFRKIGILYEDEEYSLGWKQAFVNSFESFPGNTVASQVVAVASADLKTQLLKLSEEKPDAYLFLALTSTMANSVLRQSKELGLNKPIIGNETFSLKTVRENNMSSEGIFVVQYVFDEVSQKFQVFQDLYRKKYGRDIQEEIYAALAADTYSILYDAIQKCGRDNECIKTFLYGIKNYQGLSGTFSLDTNGDTNREFEIKMIRDGKLVAEKDRINY